MMLDKLSVQGVHLFWIIIGQGPIAFAVGAGGVIGHIFLLSIFSFFLSGRRPDTDKILFHRAV